MFATIVSVTHPPFFTEVAALLVATALVAYVCNRLGIMPIVSFLVTGALIGPHALGLVHDQELIEAAAEIGVILLLFTIGIEFSLEKLSRIKRLIFIGGGLQVLLVIALVTGLLALFGVDWRTGVFTGCLVALSSTAIVMKLLMSARDMGSREGQASLGILIFQDLAVVAMVLVIPMLGGMGGGGWGIALALGKAALIVALVILVARRIMPPVLEAVGRTCSQEIFLLSVVAICFGTAFVTSLAGVSLSLGAFLAGLVVSESRFSHLAFGEILPLQILFSAAFFVSVGLLLDLTFLMAHPFLVLGIVAAVLAIKVLTTGLGLLALGYSASAAMCSAVLLAQVGEFSFVLERTGRGIGLYPAGLEVGGPETFIAATVALMIATPFLYRAGDVVRRHGIRRRKEKETLQETEAEQRSAAGDLRDHVIIAGLGTTGRWVARALDERRIPYVILTLSPDGARAAETGQLRVLRGNYTRQHELEVAGLKTARMLVVADDDLETTARVVAAARSLNPLLPILARTRFAAEAEELRAAGAEDVVTEEHESSVRLLTGVLEAYETAPDEIERYRDRIRASSGVLGLRSAHGLVSADTPAGSRLSFALTERQRQSLRCNHVGDAAVEVTPSAPGCEECLAVGHNWVHLRICMMCGHVGCCDSSPNKHATKHYQHSGHPIVKSLEPGEEWVWCYVDQGFL